MNGYFKYFFDSLCDIVEGKDNGKVFIVWYIDFISDCMCWICDIMWWMWLWVLFENVMFVYWFLFVVGNENGFDIVVCVVIVVVVQDWFDDMCNVLFLCFLCYMVGVVMVIVEVLDMD